MKKLFYLAVAIFILVSCGFLIDSSSQKIIKTTLEHPFLVDGEWIAASDLQEGQIIENIEGEKVKITGIEQIVEDTQVYNLETDVNNYVVSDSDLIVHNSNKIVGKRYVAPLEKVDKKYLTKDTISHVEDMVSLSKEEAKFMKSSVVPEQYRWSSKQAEFYSKDVARNHDASKMLVRFQRVAEILRRLNVRAYEHSGEGFPLNEKTLPQADIWKANFAKKELNQIHNLNSNIWDYLHAQPQDASLGNPKLQNLYNQMRNLDDELAPLFKGLETSKPNFLLETKAKELILDYTEAGSNFMRASEECHSPASLATEKLAQIAAQKDINAAPGGRAFIALSKDSEKLSWYLKATEYAVWKTGQLEKLPENYVPPEFFYLIEE